MLDLSNPSSTLKIIGCGFLAGCLFAILIMLIFDWLKEKNNRPRESDENDSL